MGFSHREEERGEVAGGGGTMEKEEGARVWCGVQGKA
jgi:hypothetical protein